MLRDEGDVRTTLAQRRHVDRQRVQAVEEIAPELALLDRLVEVLVRGGDDAHVHLHRVRRAHAIDFAGLDGAQQLGLGLEREVADLVEEQRALVGALEPAALLLHRAGEGPLLVTEQLALDEVLGNGCAVELDQGFLGTLREPVERFGHQILAGAVLAGDQHLGLGRRRPPDLGDEPLDRRALAEDAERIRGRARFGEAQRRDLCGLRQDVEEALRIDGLLDEVERPALERLHRGRDRALARNHDDARLRRLLADHRQRLEPAHARHVDVEQDGVEAPLLHRFERSHAVGRYGHAVPFVLQHAAQRSADLRIVVDHQDLQRGVGLHATPFSPEAGGSHRGTRKRATAPPPSRSSSVTAPRCWIATSRTSESPRPLPRRLVLT